MSLSYINQACTIYCEGSVLQAVQLAQIYNDSKTFVDMPMKYDPNVTLAAFNNISDPSNKQQLENYLNEYFLPAGSDLNDWVPTDFNSQPAFLESITDINYQSWASDINQLWLTLGREVNSSVHENPQRHSFLPRNYPMIVPGGRFRESYYWDSWWIVRGLLVCDMSSTALNVINNLLDDVNTFGFVPNGGRIYYLDRSQPPLLSEMVVSYKNHMIESYGETDSIKTFLTSAYETLLLEYSFWMNETLGHCVTMPAADNNGATNISAYRLNRYYSNYTTPRPESYLQDYDNAHAASAEQSLAAYYQQIRAGAETGWDFSSRWIRSSSSSSGYNLTNIHTNEVIPVDLNSIMYRFELNIASLATVLSSWAPTTTTSTTTTVDYITQAETFTQAAQNRSIAIDLFLWDATSKHWRDYNLTSQQWTHNSEAAAQEFNLLSQHSSAGPNSRATTTTTFSATASTGTVSDTGVSYVSVAYWLPMWAGLLPADGSSADEVVASLQTSGLLQPGGVLTTTVSTGQQWDAPNAWPPEVLFTIEGLQKLDTPSSNSLASELSQQWLNTGYIAYNNTGYMYEKYNAYELGVGGGGGEYVPQIGFGWTNGVALILLRQAYPTSINSDSDSSTSATIIAVSCLAAFIGILFIVMLYLHIYFPVQHSSSNSTATITVVTPVSQKLSSAVSGGGVTMRPLSPELSGSSKHSNSVLDV